MLKRKYFKNFILCGELGNYCLLCQTYVKGIDTHLRQITHQMKPKIDRRMPQYTKDSIFKVDSHFYCSLCNITMQDVQQIKPHILSDTHKKTKSNPKAAFARVEVKMMDEHKNDIAIDPKNINVHVTHMQWHGIMDKKCILCNVPVSNIAGHIYSADHLIKLIQTRVECVGEQSYRKTTWYTFQCFNCNLECTMDLFDDHFTNHSKNKTTVESYKEICDLRLKNTVPKYGKVEVGCCVKNDDDVYPKVLCATCMETVNKTKWDTELLAGIKDDYLEVDKDTKLLICKECKKIVHPSANVISNHLYSHCTYHTIYSSFRLTIGTYIDKYYVRESIDHGLARSKAAQYAKMHYIKLNASGSIGYCTLCDKYLSASIDTFKSHVGGGTHKGHLELKNISKPEKHVRYNYKPTLTHELIKMLSYSADLKAFWINQTILMYEESFFLIKSIAHGKHYNRTKCFACDETVLPDEVKEHCISWKHKSNWLGAQSIFEDKSFMREIRPRLYHCGLCNVTLPYWETVLRHSKQYEHDKNVKDTTSGEAVSELAQKLSFSKEINLKTNKDNIYMQLLNAVFNTKYIIKFDN